LCPLFGVLIEKRYGATRPGLRDFKAQVVQQQSPNARTEGRAALRGRVTDEQQHAMPTGFEFIGETRNLCDVVGEGDVGAAGARPNGEIACGRKVGTVLAVTPDFEFDAEQRMARFDYSLRAAGLTCAARVRKIKICSQ
jgi:hypothetical protein